MIFMAMILLFAQITFQGGTKLDTGAMTETINPAGDVLTAIDVSPTSMTLGVGQTFSVTATGIFTPLSPTVEMFNEDKRIAPGQDVTSQCTWTSSNTAVATIGPKANPQTVTAVGIGSATITCTIGAIFGISQVTVAGVVVTPVSIPNATVNTAYTTTFGASGGTPPYTFSVSAGAAQLTAAGFSLSGATLSGTPTVANTVVFDITATDSATPTHNTGTRQYAIVVQPPAGTSNRVAILPQVWGNPHEGDFPVPCNASTNCYQKFIHNATTGGGDYPCTVVGLRQAYSDWVAAPANQWWEVIVDDGLSPNGKCSFTGTTGVNITFNAKLAPTGWWWIHSAHPTTKGQTVCNHMTSVDPSIDQRAPQCPLDTQHFWYMTSTSTADGYLMNMGNVDSAGNGPSHIRITNGEFEPKGKNENNPILFISNYVVGDPNSMCHHVGFEYNYFHGDRFGNTGSSVSGATMTNGFAWGCSGWVNRNYFEAMGRPGAEGHAVSFTDAQPGTMVVGNFFEGSSVAMFVGGRIPSLGTNFNPSDIEYRKNYWGQNPGWIIGGTGAGTACGVTRLAFKNSAEFKLGVRILLDGNIFQWSNNCAQDGSLLTLNVRSCSGGVSCDGYGSAIQDVTVTNNIQRHGGTGMQTAGRSSGANAGLNPSLPGRRWNVINNLFYDIANNSRHSGNTPLFFVAMSGGASGSIRWTCDHTTRDSAGVVTLDCNEFVYRTITSVTIAQTTTRSTCTATTTTTATVTCGGTAVPRPCLLNNCYIVTINFTPATTYVPYPLGERITVSGVTSSATSMNANSRIVCGTASNCPSNTGSSVVYRCGSTSTVNNNDSEPTCPTGLAQVTSGTLARVGMKQTVTGIGDPVSVWSCVDTTFNTPGGETSGPTGIVGPRALPGTITNGLIIKYQSIAGSPGSTTGCIVSNLQGWWGDSIVSHNTSIGEDTGTALNNAYFRNPNVRSGPPFPYVINTIFQDNMDIINPAKGPAGGGWVQAQQSEGQVSQRASFDWATSQVDHLTIAGRASKFNVYRRYDSVCFAAGTCPLANAAGTVSSPATYWGPAVGPCPGSTVTTSGSGWVLPTSCDGPGFVGMMNNVPFLLDSPDPLNDYVLQPYTTVGSGPGNTCTANCGSPYARGGPRQASDGTDMGANMNKIRHAFQRTIYDDCSAATGTCGTGPNPE